MTTDTHKKPASGDAVMDVCELCGGDCAAANPPVIYCPMRYRDELEKGHE